MDSSLEFKRFTITIKANLCSANNMNKKEMITDVTVHIMCFMKFVKLIKN